MAATLVFVFMLVVMVMAALMIMVVLIIVVMMVAAMMIPGLVIVVMVMTAAMVMIIMLAVSVNMHMTVADFGFGGLANINHVHMKLQGETCKRMIAVNHHVITGNGFNKNRFLAGIGIRQEGIPDMKLHISEHGLIHSLHQGSIPDSVCLFRSHGNIHPIPGLMSHQGFR